MDEEGRPPSYDDIFRPPKGSLRDPNKLYGKELLEKQHKRQHAVLLDNYRMVRSWFHNVSLLDDLRHNKKGKDDIMKIICENHDNILELVWLKRAKYKWYVEDIYKWVVNWKQSQIKYKKSKKLLLREEKCSLSKEEETNDVTKLEASTFPMPIIDEEEEQKKDHMEGVWNIVKGIYVRPGSEYVDKVEDVASLVTRIATVMFVLPTAEQTRWDIKDAQAHALIVLFVKRRNEAKIALMRKELESKIVNEEDDMDTFLAGVKVINEQLISTGEVILDSSLVAESMAEYDMLEKNWKEVQEQTIFVKEMLSDIRLGKRFLLYLRPQYDTPATSDSDVHARRRRRAPSPSPSDGRISSSSRSSRRCQEGDKKGEKKRRKKKPSSSPPSQSSSDSKSSSSSDANSRKSHKRRGHQRIYAAWKGHPLSESSRKEVKASPSSPLMELLVISTKCLASYNNSTLLLEMKTYWSHPNSGMLPCISKNQPVNGGQACSKGEAPKT
ncbi:hypothetical protein L7F22_049467 [Adiantum nelumboides]|nr:hypothetical protein [Adiantum nelumboides]